MTVKLSSVFHQLTPNALTKDICLCAELKHGSPVREYNRVSVVVAKQVPQERAQSRAKVFADEQRHLAGIEAQLPVGQLVLDRVLPELGRAETKVEDAATRVQVVALVEAHRVVAE